MNMTYRGAKDEMFAALKTLWDAETPAVYGGAIPTIFWDGVPPAQPVATASWAFVTLRHVAGSQVSLSDPAGLRRFEKNGIITVSVFSPLIKGLALGEKLAEIAKKSFEGKSTPGGVWFKNVRIVEVGPDGPWFMWNVLAEFRYDELV
jgi:hypothetical protein